MIEPNINNFLSKKNIITFVHFGNKMHLKKPRKENTKINSIHFKLHCYN